jgi:histone-lysine N-methyltransferase SETMAR
MKGVVYLGFLDVNQMITAVVYSQQLQGLHEVLLEKRSNLMNQKDVILLHDNATPHVAQLTQRIIEQFGWEVLAHPPWSPDLSPSDYHVFLSLRSYLRDKHYADFDELKPDVTVFLESKPTSFYKHGIELLPARWAKVVKNNGNHIAN